MEKFVCFSHTGRFVTSSVCVAIGNTLSHESIRVALWLYIFMLESCQLHRKYRSKSQRFSFLLSLREYFIYHVCNYAILVSLEVKVFKLFHLNCKCINLSLKTAATLRFVKLIVCTHVLLNLFSYQKCAL